MSILYAGLDVSLELTSVCVVNADGQLLREAKVPSESKVIADVLGRLEGCYDASACKLVRCRDGGISG